MGETLSAMMVYGWLGYAEPSAEEMEAFRKQQAREKAAKATKEDEARHKKTLVQVKAQVEYEARLERLEDAARELMDGGPSLKKLIDTLIGAKDEAVNILSHPDPKTGPNYAAALAALQKVKIADSLEKGRKLIAEADRIGADRYPVPHRKADAIIAKLDSAECLLTNDAADEVRAQINEIKKRFRTAEYDSDVHQKAHLELDTLAALVTTTQQVAEANKAALENLRPIATDRLERLRATLTDKQHALLARQLSGLDALVADKDFIAALELINAFNAAADKAEAEASPGKDHWESGKKDIATLLKTAKEQLASQSPAVQAQARQAVAALEALANETPGKTITYAVAVARLDDCRRLVGGLTAESEKFTGFLDQRAKAAEQVKQAAATVTVALAALDSTVQQIDPKAAKGAASTDFQLQLDGLTREFETRAKTAYDPATLDLDGTLAKLKSLATAILQASLDGAMVAKLMSDQALAEARAGYGVARAAAQKEIDRARGMDTSAGAALAADLQIIDDKVARATLPGEIDKPILDVGALARTAQERADASAKELAVNQAILTEEAKAITAKLAELDKLVKAIGNDKRRADYEKLHAALSFALEQQSAMIGLSQLSLLAAAVPDILKLAGDVDEAIRAVKGAESWFGGDTVNFSDIKGYFADMKKRLNETELRRFMGNSVFQKTQEVTELEKTIGADPIMDLRRKIGALGRSITALEAKAVQSRKDYDTFVKEVEAIKAKLKGDIFKQAPKYTAFLQGELVGTLPQAASEGGLVNARAEAKRLETLIDGYLKDDVTDERGVPVALSDREAEAVAAGRADKENAAKWDGTVKVLGSELDRLTGIEKSELSNLKKMLADADKGFKKDGVYDAAMAKLRAVRERMELLVANPQGLKFSARNRLPEVNQKWKESVGAFKDELKGISGKVSELVSKGDLTAAGEKAVTDTLASVRALFSITAFDTPIAAMTSANGTKESRAAAREEALRGVRRFRAYLTEDYRVLELGRNPWVKSMNGTIAALNAALADLENNMMVSL